LRPVEITGVHATWATNRSGTVLENTVVRWVIVIAVALAIIGLIGYARGDDSDDGRSPEPGDALPVLIQDSTFSLSLAAT
jgi:hypothetical protein